MRVPWIIGNWSSGLEDNSRFLGWLSTVAVETTTTKIETTGDRPDDRAQEAEERRERERESEGNSVFRVIGEFWWRMGFGGPAKRSCKRDARAIGPPPGWYINCAADIYAGIARCPPAAYRIARLPRYLRIARMARATGRPGLDQSKRGQLEI